MRGEKEIAEFLQYALADIGEFLEANGDPPLTAEQARTLGEKLIPKCAELASANPELAPDDLGFLARALAFDLLADMLFNDRPRSEEDAMRLGLELCAAGARHANARIVAARYREFTPAQRTQLVKAISQKANTLATSGMGAASCTEQILHFVDVAIGLVLGEPESGNLVN